VKTPNIIKEIEATRAKLAALEKAAAAEQRQLLVGLPAKLGFADLPSLVAALQALAGPQRKGPAGAAKTTAPAKGKKRRTRAVVTDATRGEVKQLVEAGKTGAEIAKAVGVSLPTVQNIKKALGLVLKRKKK
jgi:DNA-binding NarL/FixJ family response regulator